MLVNTLCKFEWYKKKLKKLLLLCSQTSTSIELEEYDVTILNNVVPALLSVFTCRLKQIGQNLCVKRPLLCMTFQSILYEGACAYL